jgi:MtN3 and saliva related transmembrane protein
MSSGEVMGLVAGALITCSFIPQIIRVYRLKSTREISLLFNLLFLVGTLIWLVYGFYYGHISIIFWNSIATILTLILLYAKFKYGRESGLAKEVPKISG